jgi:hypothetical protein
MDTPTRRNGFLNSGGIQIEVVLAAVDEHRVGTDPAHSQCRCDERVGRGNHLVAWSDSARLQSKRESIETRADADAMALPAVDGKLLLEVLELLPEDEARVVDDAPQRLVDFGPKLSVIGCQVYERDVAHWSIVTTM